MNQRIKSTEKGQQACCQVDENICIDISFWDAVEFQLKLRKNKHFSIRQPNILPFLEYQCDLKNKGHYCMAEICRVSNMHSTKHFKKP